MNGLVLGMSIISLWFVAFGLIFGLSRGNGRSIARFAVILLCVAAAFFLREPIANALLKIDVGGMSLQESLIQAMPENAQQMGDILIRLVKLLFAAISFVLLFVGLKLLTALIVNPILFAVIAKPRKPKRLLGGVFGLLQGALIALVICIPLNGIITNGYQIVSATSTASETAYVCPIDNVYADATEESGGSDGADNSNGSQGQGNSSETGSQDTIKQLLVAMEGYVDSPVGKIYQTIGQAPFDLIGSVTIDGKKYTVSGQLGAFRGLLELSDAFGRISGDDGNVFDLSNAENAKKIFRNLDTIWSGLTDESKATVSEIAKAVSSATEGEIDLSQIDFEKLDFKKEGEIFGNISEIYNDVQTKESPTIDDFKKLTDEVVKSDIVLPLAASESNVNIADVNVRTELTDYVNNMNVSADKKDLMLIFLGLSGEGSASGETGGETKPEGTTTQTE